MTTAEVPLPASNATRRLGPRRVLTALGNEVHKGLSQGWDERVQIIIELPLFWIFVVLLSYTVGRGNAIAAGNFDWTLDDRQATWLVVGFIGFAYVYLYNAKLFWRFLAEIQTGTIEQLYLSPLPPWLVVTTGRIVAAVIETFVVVGLVFAGLSLLVDLDVSWRPDALLPLMFLALGTIGFSLIITALTLLWKRIELLNDLLFTLMMLFAGGLIPLVRVPDWIAGIARALPMTHAVAALRTALIDNRSPTQLGGDGGLLWLTATAAIWLLAGIAAFHLAESVVKRRGTLAHY